MDKQTTILSRFEGFVWCNQLTFLYICLLTLVFTAARIAFIVSNGGDAFDAQFLSDTFYWGSRIDLRTATIICLVFYLLTQLLILIKPLAIQRLMSSYRIVLLLLLCLSFLMVVVNHFYYQNFQNHIDIFIFEFLDWENTVAVSTTIWDDYPVLPSLLLMVLMFIFFTKLLQRFQTLSLTYLWVSAKKFRAIYVVASILLIFLSARGSVGTFPLTLSQISIAGDLLLNRAVANGPIAFVDAWTEWQRMKTLKPVSDRAFHQAYEDWFNQPYQQGDDVFVRSAHIQQKDIDLPHVVVVQMESFGAHVASLHHEQNQLLGTFAQHRDEDFWFTQFLSSAKGTLFSLEKLLTNTGLRNISKSSYRKTSFSSAPARAFQQLGYHTVFLTGGAKTWANLDQFLGYQGFDEVLNAEDIHAMYPKAEHDHSWGMFDEHTLKFAAEYLQRQHEKPVFLYVMTITNHSPYILPPSYQPPAMQVPRIYENRVIKGNMEKAELVMQTFQYSSNQLGLLMNNIKSSSLKDKTIVAATGDHYMRDLFNYYIEESDLIHQYTVPFYLYLPQSLQGDTMFDSSRIGSHKDIFPTIFSRIVHQSPLLGGRDLLMQEFDANTAVGISEEFAISVDGAVLHIGKEPLFYRWDHHQNLVLDDTPSEQLQILAKKHRAYSTLLRWHAIQDVEKQKQLTHTF